VDSQASGYEPHYLFERLGYFRADRYEHLPCKKAGVQRTVGLNKRMITRRFVTVELVTGIWQRPNNKGLDCFTMRGWAKVDGQWKLYCQVHNIEKLAHYGYVS
jgi:hypothetical protein